MKLVVIDALGQNVIRFCKQISCHSSTISLSRIL